MKKGLIFLFILILAMLPTVPVKGYTLPERIRVGLENQYKERDSIPVSNTLVYVGYAYNGSFAPSGIIQSSSGFTVQPVYTACVQAAESYASYDNAWQAAAQYGAAYAPALDSLGEWRVYGVGFASEASARSEASVIGGTYLAASISRVALYRDGKPSAVFDNTYTAIQVMDASGGTLSLGGTTYRGIVEFGRYAGRKITAVNVLTIDEYLYSVVASEMPVSFQPEALKAQAVAARSYTLTRMGVHQSLGYDLCDLSHCQNYKGITTGADAAVRAVNDTTGQALYYDGKPINAVYFSSSGGVTDDSANVWTNAVPYLQSVAEIYEYEPKIWTRQFTLTEITALLTANNINIGSATGVSVTRISASGRVQELAIYGSLGTKLLTKEEIRTFFSPSTGGTLESRNFIINNGETSYTSSSVVVTDGMQAQMVPLTSLYALSASGVPVLMNTATAYDGTKKVSLDTAAPVISTGNGNGLVFTGRGWGHGVGMSQRGAEGMARMGYDYKTILLHYYTGVVIA